MKLFLFAIFLFITISSYGQEIVFAEGHTSEGEPVNSFVQKQMTQRNLTVDIIFDFGDVRFGSNVVYLYIDIDNEGVYRPYDSKSLEPDTSKNWLSYKYSFKEPGKYKVYFRKPAQENLAVAYLTLTEGSFETPRNRSNINVYYQNSRMYFCEWVLNKKPINEREKVSVSDYDGMIYVYLKNNAPLNTDTLIVDVWREIPGLSGRDEFYETMKFRMNPNWPDVYFKYYFDEPGYYNVQVYNDKFQLINSKRIQAVQ